MHQAALAYCRGGLHQPQLFWPPPDAQRKHSTGDGARTDDHILMASQVQLIDQRPHPGEVDLPVRGDQAGPDFDDYTHFECGSEAAALVSLPENASPLSRQFVIQPGVAPRGSETASPSEPRFEIAHRLSS